MRRRVAGFALVAGVVLLLLGIYGHLFVEVFLGSDTAYVHLQTKELLTLRLLDPLHIGYAYCGLLDHLVAAILSYLLPHGFAILIGILSFYLAGYFCLRHAYPEQLHPYLLAVLIIQLPNPFFQSFAAQGGHTVATVLFFVGSLLLSHTRFQTASGEYRAVTYGLAGLASGLAVYGFLLSGVVAVALAGFLLFYDGRSIIRETAERQRVALALARKLGIGTVGFLVGYSPHMLSMALFPNAHTFVNPTRLNASSAHLASKVPNVIDTLAYLFSPIFGHQFYVDDKYSHENLPISDVIMHVSAVGYLISAACIGLFAILAFRRLRSGQPRDRFAAWLVCASAATLLAFMLRDLTITPGHASRHLLVLYFTVSLGILGLLPARAARWLAVLLVGLALASHVEIIETNLDHLNRLKEQSSCESLSKGEVIGILDQIAPEAMAGGYWAVWPVAMATDTRLVYDVPKNKFAHLNGAFAGRPLLLVEFADDEGRWIDEVLGRWPIPPGASTSRVFTTVRLGPYNLYFEDMTPAAWQRHLANRGLPPTSSWSELVDRMAGQLGKGKCRFRRSLFEAGEWVSSRSARSQPGGTETIQRPENEPAKWRHAPAAEWSVKTPQ